MSVTVTNPLSLPFATIGTRKRAVRDVAFDSSYPTGGEPLVPADFGLNAIEYARSELKTTATTTVNIANIHYDETNQKLLAFDETPAEVANAADLAGAVARVEAIGW